jgi:hypothetical protein
MKHWNNNAASQKFVTKPVRLMTYKTSAPGPQTAHFSVPIPDSRLRVKVSTLWVGQNGSNLPDLITAAATLWLAEYEIDQTGQQGNEICTNNILGTQAAPQAIANVAPSYGYSVETVSAADFIKGVLSSSNPGDFGSWVLQCRYQPDSVRFAPDEWAELVGQMNPILEGALAGTL